MKVNETIATEVYHIEYSPKVNSKYSTQRVGDWKVDSSCKDLDEDSAKSALEWSRKNFHYNNYRAVKTVSTQTILDW